MIAAIILAAGASKRLGHPKQLAEIGGETLLHRAIRTAHEAGCTPVIVVLGACHEEILANSDLSQAETVIHSAWRQGMATSIHIALKSVPNEAEGLVLMTCDQPAVSAPHLRLIMASGRLTASAYAGRQGVPAYFPASMFLELQKLHGDTGARELLHHAAAINLPNGDLDVDTQADLDKARLLFG